MKNNYRYAGLGIRFLALIIDMLLSAPIYAGAIYILGEGIVSEIILTIFFILIYAILFASNWQGSPGMRLLHIKAVDKDFNKITLKTGVSWGIISLIIMSIALSPVIYLRFNYDIEKLNEKRQELIISPETDRAKLLAEMEDILGSDYQSFSKTVGIAMTVSLGLFIFWGLNIMFSREKAGIHNIFARVRFVRD